MLCIFFKNYPRFGRLTSDQYRVGYHTKNKKIYSDIKVTGYSITTTLFLGLIFLLMLSSSSRTELGNIVDHLHCVAISLHSHFSNRLPGFVCLVEVEDGVEIGKAEFVKAGKAAGRVVESGEVDDVGVVVVIKGEGHFSEKVELVKVFVDLQIPCLFVYLHSLH